jgi:hypothetical protein
MGRRSRSPLLLAPALCLALTVPAVAALTGTVTDPERKPIAAAKVCYLLRGAEGLCVETDARGFFELPESRIDTIGISAEGYVPRTLAAAVQDVPIELRPAAKLLVRFRSTKDDQPIAEGKLFLILPSGQRRGPFPFNRQGVRIGSLEAGSYGLLARAEGMAQQKAVAVTLEERKQAEVVVEMSPIEPTEGD